jgi:hypothetical protein
MHHTFAKAKEEIGMKQKKRLYNWEDFTEEALKGLEKTRNRTVTVKMLMQGITPELENEAIEILKQLKHVVY